MCLYTHKDFKGLGSFDTADAESGELEFEYQWEHKMSQSTNTEN